METQPKRSRFFAAGGTLPLDSPSYIRREADVRLYNHLSQGDFCYVLDSRQVGKSSLMVRVKEHLKQDGVRVAQLDLQSIGQNVTAEQWYGSLVTQLGDELGLGDELYDFFQDEKKQERFGPLQRWVDTITEVVLRRCPGHIVIFVDEIDQVRTLQSRFSTDEFFTGIRELFNRRSSDPELCRITFCLIGCATPSDLIRDVRTTPFNIGQRIELTDFTPAEAAGLAEGLGRDPQVAKALIERILYWTGGHPFLTQRFCQEVANRDDVTTSAGIDQMVEDLYFSRRGRVDDHNLRYVNDKVHEASDLAGLLDLYRRIRRDKPVPDDPTNPLISIMRLSGITRIAQGYHYVRNRIYYRVFDRQWIRQNMPGAELRRQRIAYIKGALAATAVLAVILGYFIHLNRKANRALDRANEQTRIAEAARRESATEQEQLQRKEADLERAEFEARVTILRERSDRLLNLTTMLNFADVIISTSPPEYEAYWDQDKGGILLQQGKLEDAEKALSRALFLAPNIRYARSARGYVRILLNRPKEALQDFDYVRDHLDANDSLNGLDRTIVLAQLGEYQAAKDTLNKAIKQWLYGQYHVMGDPRVAPEITQATDRTVVFLDPDGFKATMYFMAANLEAYSGNLEGYKEAADRARHEVERLPEQLREDVYLEAINWAWFHLQSRPGDYGALISQAALWQAANHPEWAACDFEKFVEQWKQKPDPRYPSLAQWAQSSLAKLDSSASSAGCSARRQSAFALEVKAQEEQARGQFDEAEHDLDAAQANWDSLRILVEKVELLFQSARANQERGNELGQQRQALEKESSAGSKKPANPESDRSKQKALDLQKSAEKFESEAKAQFDKLEQLCNQIISIAPRTPAAYTYRALVRYWRNRNEASKPRTQAMLADLQTALDAERSNALALSIVDGLVPQGSPDETVAYLKQERPYLERYQQMWAGNQGTYLHLATLANAENRYLDGAQLANNAIAMERENLEPYELRAIAERGLNLDRSLITSNFVEGVRQAASSLTMRGRGSSQQEEAWRCASGTKKEGSHCDPTLEAYLKTGTAEAAPGGKPDALECDSILDACVKTAIVEAPHNEVIWAVPLSFTENIGAVCYAIIDKGTKDGAIRGGEVDFYSLLPGSNREGNPKTVVIGIGRVESAGPDSALVRVNMLPQNDSSDTEPYSLRKGDVVGLFAQTPKVDNRSQLWVLAKRDITLLDRENHKIVDYRTLYANETQELDDQLLTALLADIRDAGHTQAPGSLHPSALEKGIGQGDLEKASQDDLRKFLDYVVKRTVAVRAEFGREWKVRYVYSWWLALGKPQA